MIRRKTLCFPVVLGLSLGHAALASASPELPDGVWVDITPPMVTKGAPETCLGQGVAVNPQNPSTIYWGSTPYMAEDGGLFKSLDGGSNWRRIGSVTPIYDGATDHLDEPLHVRVDPNDPNHLYVGDGVRGTSQGFFVSHDGGETFEKPPGWKAAIDAAGIGTEDVYDVAVDPDNFEHALVSFHSAWGWTDTKWNMRAGVMETLDGGQTFVVHEPASDWGAGHSIKFLYDPEKGIGDSYTWLLGTQGGLGMWRTDNAGTTWTKVAATSITHGGSTTYYSKTGVLYSSGVETTQRSTDNGLTWENVGPVGSWSVHGDGDFIYSGGGFEYNGTFMVTPEDDGVNWMPFSDQMFHEGPYEMAYDQFYGIMYSSNWSTGLFALKANEGSGAIPPITHPDPIPPGGAGSGGGSGTGGGTSQGGTSAAANKAEANSDSGGCGCHTVHAASPTSTAFAGLLLVASSLRRRKRARVKSA